MKEANKVVLVLENDTFIELVRILDRVKEAAATKPELLLIKSDRNVLDPLPIDTLISVIYDNYFLLSKGRPKMLLTPQDILMIVSALGNKDVCLTERLMKEYAKQVEEVEE